MNEEKNIERKKNNNKNKKKNKKVDDSSEADLTEFLLDFEKRYSTLKTTFLMSFLFYSLFGLYAILNNLLLYSLISLLAILFGIIYLEEHRRINFKQYNAKTIDDFIIYLDPQDNQVDKNKKKGKGKKSGKKKGKRVKSFNKIGNIIEKIQQDYFIKTINRSGSILMYELICFVFFSPFFIFVIGLPLIYAYPYVFGALSEIIGIIILTIVPRIGVIIYSITIIYLYLKLIDLNNVRGCSELFKSRVEQNLDVTNKVLNSFLKRKIRDIKPEEIHLIPSLQQWYEFYCSDFSVYDNLNEIISKYYKFIFSIKKEIFYLELFSKVKGKIIDYEEIQLYQDKNQAVSSFSSALNIIENYIGILKNSIEIKTQKKKEQRERWNTAKNFIYLIIAPISFVLSIIAILKP